MRSFSACLLCLLLSACSGLPTVTPAPAGFYRVQPGDTLYRIAQQHGQSVSNLSNWNKLSNPSSINSGQLLRISPPPGNPLRTAKPPPDSTSERSAATSSAPAASADIRVSIRLRWPLTGNILARFNGNSNKGIDIAGKEGDVVQAAAAGTVVYAGKGIRAYGNLLIIKHGNDYLTAYAHNRELMVKEGQRVTQGQQVATVGHSGASRDMLHFELRHQGKAIDPLSALPAQ